MSGLLAHSGNLLQNASFETDLAYWQAYSVTTTDSNSSEGTQAASLAAGVASLYQDVALGRFLGKPLFLSFIVYTQGQAVIPSDLIVEVLWLNVSGTVIGTGLRDLLPRDSISQVRNTFFDVTDRPPLGTVWARLKFSKNTAETPIELDLVNLTPVESKNLLNNPSFEAGLDGWNSVNFNSQFVVVWDGSAAVQGTFQNFISQEVNLNPFRLGSAYLLSFAAATAGLESATMTARLIFINVLGNPIGEPGIDATIVPSTLTLQGKYLNFVQLSGPAPIGAVKARLEISVAGGAETLIVLDQVILMRMASANLIRNSEFNNGLNDWTGTNIGIVDTGGYVGLNYVQLASLGGLIKQTVALPPCSVGHNFLLNFALRYRGSDSSNGNVIAQINWLDVGGNEIGLGLSLIVLQVLQQIAQWQVYTGITEPVPLGAVYVKVQFTKSGSAPGTEIGLDSVIFARID